MYRIIVLFGLAITLSLAGLHAQRPQNPSSADITPAERAINAARARIAQDARNHEAYNHLAMAYARRARETGGHDFYHMAEDAVKMSLRLQPDNFGALLAKMWVLLGEHEFAEARELGLELKKRNPDELQLHGYLGDACAELGLYEEAEGHIQTMLDLRPPSPGSLTRAAYLREIFGNLEGALDAMATSYRMTPDAEVEDRAWILTHIGHLYLLRGNLPMARQVLTQASDLFPNYHYTLANLAKLAEMEGNWEESERLLQKRYEISAHPENLFELARVQERAGKSEQARANFLNFAEAARAESNSVDNANRELITYYLHFGNDKGEALRLARMELSRRRDVTTLQRAAEALLENGAAEEAATLLERVLSVGYRDADVLLLAGEVMQRQNQSDKAMQYFAEAAAFNPRSEAAKTAMKNLRKRASVTGVE